MLAGVFLVAMLKKGGNVIVIVVFTGLRCYTCTTEVECDAENVPYESCGNVDSICIGINVTATVVIGKQ